jgi:hypothetical protein
MGLNELKKGSELDDRLTSKIKSYEYRLVYGDLSVI